jgi:hypothetical protein
MVVIVTPDAPPPPSTVYEYGDVPPASVSVATPLLPPLHDTPDDCVADTENVLDCEMLTDVENVQLKLSVTTIASTPAFSELNVDVPADKPVATCVPDTDTEYDAVPPEMLSDAVPSPPARHESPLVSVAVALSAAAGCVIVKLELLLQPLLSVTVTLYTPALNDEKLLVPAVTEPVKLPVIVYGAVPPDTITCATPLLPPKHDTAELCDEVTLSADGSLIVTDAVVVQLLASVTVMVLAPALNALTVYGAVVRPVPGVPPLPDVTVYE